MHLEFAVSSAATFWTRTIGCILTVRALYTWLAELPIKSGQSVFSGKSWFALFSLQPWFSVISIISCRSGRSSHAGSSGHSQHSNTFQAVDSFGSWISIASILSCGSFVPDVALFSDSAFSAWRPGLSFLSDFSWQAFHSIEAWGSWWSLRALNAALGEVEVDWEGKSGKTWWA